MALVLGFSLDPMPEADGGLQRYQAYYRATENIGYAEGYAAGYAVGVATAPPASACGEGFVDDCDDFAP
ncbi:MAG: hypothetical protein M3619_00560 [Myxococcota bacterium]|nr:hypothetical protein [Myxococcota bacterium]